MNISRTFRGNWLRVLLAGGVAAALVFQGCKLAGYDQQLTSITVTHPNPTIARMTTEQFTASGRYNDDSVRDITNEVTWTTSDPAVASVDGGGLATPAAGGTVVVTASLDGVSGAASLNVSNAQLETIEVTPADPSIANGTRVQLTAIGHFDDLSQQNLTTQATWTSSEPTVTIGDSAGSKGLASSTALGAATSTITAAFAGIYGSTTLTVKAVTLESITVAPATATITVGNEQQFTATGAFSDSSTQVMTGEVAWSSSDPNTADFIAGYPGRAKGWIASATSVSITATSSALLGSVAGSAQLSVKASSGNY